ncbi:MAG: NAD+ synthase [Deltaproteobacteria bacterium]|nr:NAD+ synthase [Deltaproteobacteria bacterium]MBW2343188.1 NAD+ synthase [Deltaproteobacteria bacterium]
MKIAVCQINPVIADFDYNISLIRDATDHAKSSGCVLAIFPEMSLLGYPPKDLLEKPSFIRENLIQLEKLSFEIEDISVLCGYVDNNPLKTGKGLINSVALITDGRIRGKGGKRLLPSYDVFDETRYFDPSPGSLSFEMGGKKWGVTICEDIWNAVDFTGGPKYELNPVSELAEKGIDVLINISASPYSTNKGALRLDVLKKLSIENRIPAVYCNQVGGNDDLLFDGSSMVVDQNGRLICLGKQFEPDLFIWDTEKVYDEIKDPWPAEEESILNGLIMGTRDYASKCGFKKTLVGLSGGIDSSLVVFIACEAMGPENVMGVSMPSPYTSQMSKDDAEKLAGNLGIHFHEIPIPSLFESYKQVLAPLFKGLEEDETEENIQARIRGNILMALSNKFNALLLTTGNKSEFAMGYCTLYGDLSGGLAVISDIPKTFCYRLADYINRNGEIIPQRTIERPPSAELRPDQTDQDTLPPYHVLDDILEAAIEKNLGLDEIIARGHDPAVVRDVLGRLVFNEYKRLQAPPGLKITTKAFGYGRRYPIARGKAVY